MYSNKHFCCKDQLKLLCVSNALIIFPKGIFRILHILHKRYEKNFNCPYSTYTYNNESVQSTIFLLIKTKLYNFV